MKLRLLQYFRWYYVAGDRQQAASSNKLQNINEQDVADQPGIERY
jgi:hypothetical protein